MKILLFIVLKVIEIGGVIFIPYFLGKPIRKYVFQDYYDEDKIINYLYGLLGLLLLPAVVLVIFMIVKFCQLNWNIVNQIIK